jgi:hypothetical protein
MSIADLGNEVIQWAGKRFLVKYGRVKAVSAWQGGVFLICGIKVKKIWRADTKSATDDVLKTCELFGHR